MKKEEMQNLVDKLADERQSHLTNIDELTLDKIKMIVSTQINPKSIKTYIQFTLNNNITMV